MTVFTEPEAAHVGLTEHQGSERFGDVEVTRYDYRVDARAEILDETDGFIKLVRDPHSTRLVGVQILGAGAAQLIAPLALTVHSGSSAATLAEVAFPPPDDLRRDQQRCTGASRLSASGRARHRP